MTKPVATFTVQQDGKIENYKMENYKASNGSVFRFVFQQNDHRGLKFLLDTATHFANQKTEDKARGYYTFPPDEFIHAIGSGRTEMLAEVIKRTGAGLPLEEMVKDSGITIAEAPEHYLGLTVYGKKRYDALLAHKITNNKLPSDTNDHPNINRSDWAEAGRQSVKRSTGMSVSPLLFAASAACLESLEWFLSDAPLRCYLEFTASKAAQDDVRITHLGQAPGGFEGAISRWLYKNSMSNQSLTKVFFCLFGVPSHPKPHIVIDKFTHLLGDLALIRAIICTDIEKALPVIKYLIKVAPDSINAKDESRFTPLMMATLLGRIDAVRLLVDQGIDQSQRHEAVYANLLHAALHYNPGATELQALLDVLDKDALAKMFTERTHHASYSESRTPLHTWLQLCLLHHHSGKYGAHGAYERVEDMLAVARLLLSLSGGRELNVIDSAGDTVLHMLCRLQPDPAIIKAILESIPRPLAIDLLNRENAVGATPLEVAYDKYLTCLVKEPEVRYSINFPNSVDKWVDSGVEEFILSSRYGRTRQPLPTRVVWRDTDALDRAVATLNALRTFLNADAGRRKLVSLNEANDVARRIGHGFQKQRYAVEIKTSVKDAEKTKTAEAAEKEAMSSFTGYPFYYQSWARGKKDNDDDEAGLTIDATVTTLLDF